MSTAAPEVQEPVKIEIPKLGDLTGEHKAPEAPEIKKVEPADTIPDKQGDNEKPVIPTDPHDMGTPKKTPAEFAEERRLAKARREQQQVDVETLRTEHEKAQGKIAELMAQLAEAQAKNEEASRKLPEFQTLAEQRAEEIEKLRTQYVSQHEADLDPYQDQEFARFDQDLKTALINNMPSMIDGKDGRRNRVIFEQIAKDPAMMSAVENATGHYAQARATGNQAAMDYAVNYVANLLGAPVVLSEDPEKRQFLERNDPTFEAIDRALRSGSTYVMGKVERANFIAQNKPQMIRQQVGQRSKAIQEMITNRVNMTSEQAAEKLRQNPNDSTALVASIVNRVPALKTQLDASVAHLSKIFGSVKDGFIVPPPADNKPETIAAHQQEQNNLRMEIAEAMQNAALAPILKLIVPPIVRERDAALERLEKHGANSNPSTGTPGSDSAVKPSIPTDPYRVA